jgi:hypothetical protein
VAVVAWNDTRVDAAMAVLRAQAAPVPLPPLPALRPRQRQHLLEAALSQRVALVLDAAADHTHLSPTAHALLLLRSRYRPQDPDTVARMAPVRAAPWLASTSLGWLQAWLPASWSAPSPSSPSLSSSPYVCASEWRELERQRPGTLLPVADELALHAQAIAAALAPLPAPWAVFLLHDWIEMTVARGLGPRHVYAYLYRCLARPLAPSARPARPAAADDATDDW